MRQKFKLFPIKIKKDLLDVGLEKKERTFQPFNFFV